MFRLPWNSLCNLFQICLNWWSFSNIHIPCLHNFNMNHKRIYCHFNWEYTSIIKLLLIILVLLYRDSKSKFNYKCKIQWNSCIITLSNCSVPGGDREVVSNDDFLQGFVTLLQGSSSKLFDGETTLAGSV